MGAPLRGRGELNPRPGLGAFARLGPPLAFAILSGPVLFGLAFTVLPAFGWLPALGGDRVSLEPFRLLLAEPGLWTSARLSLQTGLGATALSTLLAMLFLAGFHGTRPFRRVERLAAPLLAVPHAAAAFGLAFLVAPSGLLARLVSPELTGWTAPPDLLVVNDAHGLALVAGLAVKEVPFLLLVALAALPQVPAAESRQLAAALGYGRVAGFLFTVWPALYRQMRLSVFAVLAFSLSVVDVAAILGPTLPATLSVRLVEWMGDPDLGRRFVASAGALLLLALAAAAALFWLALERLLALARDRLAGAGRRFPRDRVPRLVALGGVGFSALALLGGFAALLLWSLSGPWPFPDALPTAFSLAAWERALPRLAVPLASTCLIALPAAGIALAVTVLCLLREDGRGRRSRLAPWLFLPLVVPQPAFLFGLQLLFLLAGAGTGLPALVLAHSVFVLPYVMLALLGPWRAFDRRFERAASALGKGPATVLFRVRLPMMLPALLSALAVGFAVSVGLYLPTLLIGAGRVSTVTTEAVALASGANRRLIGAYALAQALLPALGFALALAVPRLLRRRAS